MADTISDIIDSFSLLDDWEDRYRYVIELGRELAPYPDSARDDVHKVPGCVSQVWLLTHKGQGTDPILTFEGDSDAHIVRGLVYILLAYFSGKKASQISNDNVDDLFKKLGLIENLTPQRSNGLKSMVARIKAEAHKASISV